MYDIVYDSIIFPRIMGDFPYSRFTFNDCLEAAFDFFTYNRGIFAIKTEFIHFPKVLHKQGLLNKSVVAV